MTMLSMLPVSRLADLLVELEAGLDKQGIPRDEALVFIHDEHRLAVVQNLAAEVPIAQLHLGVEEIQWNLDIPTLDASASQETDSEQS